MPLISVVVPVHRVAEYLPGCLESILDQSFADFEVIAVNDQSPDQCGKVLDAYARRDRRVRVSHLDTNVGLGRARGAGFALSTGEYVWFVDGDDEVADGALQAIADRLREVNPEMLLLDYDRRHWSGVVSRSNLDRALPLGATPDVFTALEQPGAFAQLHTAWSRVLHRGLVLRAGLPFHSGWYEDVSFSFPLLVAAKRVSVLHRVCYHYRDGRPGAITATAGERHFEVFEQYERLFATLDRWRVDAHGEVRSHIFERMLWHYRWILNSSTRVPAPLQRAFFARMSEHVQLFRPLSSAPQPALETFKRNLIANDAWRTFAALRSANRFGRNAKGRIRGVLPAHGRWPNELNRRTQPT